MKDPIADPVLKTIIDHLKDEYRCHTVLLYGSRARGEATPESDYDVLGIRKSGKKTRIARKKRGYYWDVFVYPERDIKNLTDQNLSWKDAVIVWEQGRYGRNLVKRIQKLSKKYFIPAPRYEIDVTKIWAQKQIDRYKKGDVHGLYRRAELQVAALADYFKIRKKRFWGPKAALKWLEMNDPAAFKLFVRVYKNPNDDRAGLPGTAID